MIGLFVELSVDCWLGEVQNYHFLFLFRMLARERPQFLVHLVNEVVKSRPNLVLLFLMSIFIGIRRCREGVAVEEEDLRVVVDFFQDQFLDFLERLVVDCNHVVSIHLAHVDQLFLNDFLRVLDHDETLFAADHVVQAFHLIFQHVVQSVLDLEEPHRFVLTEYIKVVREVQLIFLKPLIVEVLVVLEFCQRFQK